MPPKRKSTEPRSYGRQANGRTIKSLSLDGDLAAWAEAYAAEHNMPFSTLIEELLANAKAQGGSSLNEAPAEYKVRKQ